MDTFTQPSTVSTYSSSSPSGTWVRMAPSRLGCSRTFKPSVLATATVRTRSLAASFASGPVNRYSRLTYPSTSPDLICAQPSADSSTSQAEFLGILPTSLPSVDGCSLTFRFPLSTLAMPMLVYPQAAPSACLAASKYSSSVRPVETSREATPAVCSTLSSREADSFLCILSSETVRLPCPITGATDSSVPCNIPER